MSDNSPTAPVDICNLSLGELKISPISSLTQQGSKEAQLCNRHYDLIRKALLRSHPWNFAKAETDLAKATSGVSASFDDVYPLPEAYLRLISVGDVMKGTKKLVYDIRSISIEGSYVRCIILDNGGSATQEIIFIRNVTSVTEFDPLFTVLFKYELANAIAPGLILKPSVKNDIRTGLADARLQSKSIDGQERPPVRIQRSKFLRARRLGRTGFSVAPLIGFDD